MSKRPSRKRSLSRKKQGASLSTDIQSLFDKALKDDGIKTVYEYPDAKCAYPNCNRKAVGADDVCEKHGGNPVVKQNLLAKDEIPDWILKNTLYDPAKHPMQFIIKSKEGKSEVEIAAEFGVGVSTVRGWTEQYLEMHHAYEIGKAAYEAWWLEEGRNNLDNRTYNIGLYKFLTGNKLGYSDKIESKSLNVTAGVLLVPGTQTADEWEAKGKEIMQDRKNGS
jgi:hypothetical protein